MPRTISSASLAKLASNFGTEPVIVLEIQWVRGGPRTTYGDKAVPGVKGVIQEISGLDDVVQVSGGSQSQQITITLNDTSGELKGILDTLDPHKKKCWVYQWFPGTLISEKFLIFQGVLNTPIEWDEGARTFKCDVVSKIEDVEVGFSIEEGDFPNPPETLIGKPWPLCFGTVVNVPALRVDSIRQGILAEGTGIHDFTLEHRLALAQKLTCPSSICGYSTTIATSPGGGLIYSPMYCVDASCTSQKCQEIERLKLELKEQLAAEYSPVRIFGGDNFPQHKLLTLNIKNGLFTGKFNGEIFTITGRLHPDNDGHGRVIKTDTQKEIESKCGPPPYSQGSPTEDAAVDAQGSPQTVGAAASKLSWAKYNAADTASFFWANGGSRVTYQSDQKIVYIANLLPSTVLRVAAFRTIDGLRSLYTVPDEYYIVRETNYTGYTAVTEIVLNKPLSTQNLRDGGGWEDEIFVTLTSSVGPNTVDILTWFIQTYTDYDIDSTSFDATADLIDNYPMHFALLERKNLINVLEEIAYQARCALWLKDDKFYIRYLSLEPGDDDTITEDDVLPNTLKIVHTPTEDLVTKYIAYWKSDYAINKNNLLILRSRNIADYGTHPADYNFYCFNILELVRKTATFWLIRKSNTWRRATFSTPLKKLTLETFDTVAMTLPDVADGTIKGTVEKANYNSDSHTIDFEVWTPCKAGTRTPYLFAWPADITEQSIFPTLEEEQNSFKTRDKAPNFHTIAPPGHTLAATGPAAPSFSIECNGGPVNFDGSCHSDKGDQKPSDRGDTKPTPKAATGNTGAVSTKTSPVVGQMVTNAYVQRVEKKADQAQQTAFNAQQSADEAKDDAGSNDDTTDEDKVKKKLPDKVGGNCTCVATIRYIIPSLVVRPPGSETHFGNSPGDKGDLADGDESKVESYTFNSKVMADEFVISKQADITARSEGHSWVVGEEQTWLVSTCVDLGIDEDPDSDNFGEPCPEPDAADRSLEGFHQAPST
jgi:hypothetical protein